MSYDYSEMNGVKLVEGSTTWGARCILMHNAIDFVHDRQEINGPNPQTIINRLNDGALREALDTATGLLRRGELRPNEDKVHVLYSDVRFEIRGNANASCGYLYLCAYDKSEVAKP